MDKIHSQQRPQYGDKVLTAHMTWIKMMMTVTLMKKKSIKTCPRLKHKQHIESLVSLTKTFNDYTSPEKPDKFIWSDDLKVACKSKSLFSPQNYKLIERIRKLFKLTDLKSIKKSLYLTILFQFKNFTWII